MRKSSAGSHKKAKTQIVLLSDPRTKPRLLLLSVLCFMCLFVATIRAQEPDLVQLFEQVAMLIRENRLPEAEKELNAVLRVTPNLPVALNFMGTIRAKQNRLLEAETLFLRAVQNDPKFTGARMNLVYLYLLKRTPAKAIPQLREVVALEPENGEATQTLAGLLLSQGNFDECISLIEKQRASRAVSPALIVMLGDAYLAKKDLAKAEENYLVALEGRLENAGALFGLAQLSRLKGETRETAIYLNRVAVLTADSKSPEFLYKFGLEAMRVEMFDEARSALQRAVDLRPKEPSYVLALGIAALRKTDLFEAEKRFRQVLEIQPGNVQGQLHLGYVLLNQKKYKEARLWLEKAGRSGPLPEVSYYLGLLVQDEGDDARAIVLFEKAVRQLPSYAHARIALGASYLRLKNYARARQELETAVQLAPDEPSGHYNLALLYARTKEPAKAEEQMRIVEDLKSKRRTSSGGLVLPSNPSP